MVDSKHKSKGLTRDSIDPAKILGSIGDPGAGAVVLFLGTVRETSHAGTVERLEYEAYEPMAEKSFQRAEEAVLREWPATKAVKIVHRLGNLRVGEVSLAVAVAAPHRGQAFEACKYAVETIKHDAPIWKRERLAGGKEVWVEGTPIGSTPAKKASSKRPAQRRRSG